MRKLIGILGFALMVGAIAACSSSSSGGLTGKTWQWTASTTKVPAGQTVVPTPADYTIEFKSDGTFGAKADCNQVAGAYTTSGSSLTITPGPSTLAACGDDSLGSLYIAELTKAKSYAIANNQLTITLTDEGTMTFK